MTSHAMYFDGRRADDAGRRVRKAEAESQMSAVENVGS